MNVKVLRTLRPSKSKLLFWSGVFVLSQSLAVLLVPSVGIPFRFFRFRAGWGPNGGPDPSFDVISLIADALLTYALAALFFDRRRRLIPLFVVPLLLLPLQPYLAIDVYPRVEPVDLCYLSYGYGPGGDVLFYPVRDQCFSYRAHTLLSPQDCLMQSGPGDCLGSISARKGMFLCAWTDDTDIMEQCVDYVTDYVSGYDQLRGIAEYRRVSERRLLVGEAFFDTATGLNGEGIPTLGGYPGVECWPSQQPALEIDNPTTRSSVFITGCEVEGWEIVIQYYEYVFD